MRASSISSRRASERPSIRTSPADGTSIAAADREHRALSASRWTDDGHCLPRLDPQVESAQGDGLGRAGPEDLEDVDQLEGRRLRVLGRPIGLDVEAPEALDRLHRGQLQRKLSLIIR